MQRPFVIQDEKEINVSEGPVFSLGVQLKTHHGPVGDSPDGEGETFPTVSVMWTHRRIHHRNTG